MTKVFFPLLGSISVELNWPVRPASTRLADLNVPDKWLSAENQRPVRICGGSVTPLADSISLLERNKSSRFIAISSKWPKMQVKAV